MADSKKVLLAVLAHPDDETFGTGGTLAYYSSLGVDVYLVCATRGEVGDVPAEMMEGYSSVAELREKELRCAAETLGLKKVFFLNYRDSGMAGSEDNHHPNALVAADQSKVIEDVVHFIRLVKPQVVITFDPIGGYRHPDHIAIQQAAEKAFYASAQPNVFEDGLQPFTPQKLYFHTFPHGFLKVAVFFMRLTGKDPRKMGKNNDIDLAAIAETKFPINAKIDYRSVAKKRDIAAACHASQGGGRLTGGILEWFRHLFGVRDQYMRAFPPPEKMERDLFSGI
jgi:N-acetyl-1-D-myo-inositol-2-amino-2-deoxy-alpha-D-glucopyranoside deacetylase